jgi:hypothetical protein
MRDFDVSNDDLAGIIPSEFGLLGHLTKLNLANNGLTGTLPTKLGQVALNSSMDTFNISHTFLSGTLPMENVLPGPRAVRL